MINNIGTLEEFHASTLWKFADFEIERVKLGRVQYWIPKMLEHQNTSIAKLAKEPRVFDMSDAGTGKTPVHAKDAGARRRKKGGCTLVLCPKSLIETAWGNDLAVFAPDMKVSLAYADNREEAFAADADIYVTNIDAAVWLANKLKSKKTDKFFDKFDHLIIDESTSVKHGTSQRSRAVAKIRRYFSVRRLLTGTPMSNGVCDIHNQMYIVDDGKLLGESFHKFRSACCIPEQVGLSAHAIKWEDKPGIEETVAALIARMAIRHKFEDCVDIPPNHQFPVEFELGANHRKLYDKLERDSALLHKQKTVTAINGAVLYGKKLQCASGAIYSDGDLEGKGEYVLLDTTRNELLIELIEARKHSIVFFNWKHQRDQLVQAAKKEGWSYEIIDGDVTKKGERERIVAAYQAGKYKVLFAHPQSAGHGLTLTRGTATIFASPTPNLEFFLQAYKRIYRIGQREKTETIMVIAKGTIDEEVWASCQKKDTKQFKFLEYFTE